MFDVVYYHSKPIPKPIYPASRVMVSRLKLLLLLLVAIISGLLMLKILLPSIQYFTG